MGLVPWPSRECEADLDLVLIQTFFSHERKLGFYQNRTASTLDTTVNGCRQLKTLRVIKMKLFLVMTVISVSYKTEWS